MFLTCTLIQEKGYHVAKRESSGRKAIGQILTGPVAEIFRCRYFRGVEAF